MPERDRLIHPVTGSLAAVFLVLLVAGLVSHANRYHSNTANGGQTSTRQLPEAPLFAGPGGGAQQASPEEREEARKEADVAAQLRMAAAAENAVYVSFLALFGLAATIFYARRAWEAARDSAKADNEALKLTRTQLTEARASADIQADRSRQQLDAMRDSAKAAWANAEATRQVSEKQARAYVHSINAEIIVWPVYNALSGEPNDFVCSLKIENVGQTIAKRVEVLYCLATGFKDETFEVRPMISPDRQLIPNLAPGQSPDVSIYSRRFLRPMSKELDAYNKAPSMTILSPKKHLHFWGEVCYSDIYGKRHRSGFQYVSKDPEINAGPMLNVTLDLPAFEEIEEEGES